MSARLSPEWKNIQRERGRAKSTLGPHHVSKPSWRTLHAWVDKRPSSSCSGLLGEEVTFVERPVEGQRMLRFLKLED